ncbi:MAG: hypothetical protein HOK21_19175 [Rhodospirillaceae bacterium]|jgi:hypothetical protein|nr:hypothetical protein [Rhodospirillaceae bacterium]MBT4688031.1 hypothetical protein [Rhodospirillaceae bacterium]MBT5083321.1 hypothetical protein [Rhodospirillaceae bacterium]MBT5526213.1 hypothetical protein [Rhodospirillaceae bacterium]MBT5882295.1 hypothetical protein [Rhodospirillaceae bacterium]
MKFICDAPQGKTWFRLETEVEATSESTLLGHAVEKHFRRDWDRAATTYKSASSVSFEQNIGLSAHVQREMALFLTLRNSEGKGLATAMLPPNGKAKTGFRIIIVGENNSDPFVVHTDAIEALGRHFGLTLTRNDCFPYGG